MWSLAGKAAVPGREWRSNQYDRKGVNKRMPPYLGLLVYLGLLWGLWRWSGESVESRALWIPVIWLCIMATRLPSQWLGLTYVSAATQMDEGSNFDRLIFLTMIALGLWVLTKRRLQW